MDRDRKLNIWSIEMPIRMEISRGEALPPLPGLENGMPTR